MKLYHIIISAIIAFVIFFLFLGAFGNLIGYMVTAVDAIALICLIAALLMAAGDIKRVFSGQLNRYAIILLCLIIVFFLVFSIFLLPKTELIFFDENIYQGVALNILHSGNALMCEYGTQYVQKCFVNQLGFDPGGWPFILAVAFKFFGIGNNTSYNLELLMGTLSIVSVFLISVILTNRKEIAIASALIFALIPELFIWSKTLANPDLPFLAFAALTVLFFLIFIKRSNKKTLFVVTSSLAFTVYLRVQALLLVPLFLVVFLTLGGHELRETFKSRIKLLFGKLFSDKRLLLILAVFLILIEPELYSMIASRQELQANAAFYLYPNTTIFSTSYISQNLSDNLSFLTGMLKDYPIIFLASITVFAAIGVIFLLLQKKYKNRFGILVLLLGLFLIYFIFFLFYFSGSVLVGVSVRYFLILYPALSILAAFGVFGLGDWLLGIMGKNSTKIKYSIYAALIFLFFVIPFTYSIPFLANPSFTYFGFPLNNVTSKLPALNPYTNQYSKTSSDFINGNYKLVPSKCLVLSEVPSLWFMLNRSSSYLPETDIFTNSTFSGYGCYYLDYGFWCTVSPYNSTICNFYKTNYKLKLLATQNSGGSANFSLYQIINYTPK